MQLVCKILSRLFIEKLPWLEREYPNLPIANVVGFSKQEHAATVLQANQCKVIESVISLTTVIMDLIGQDPDGYTVKAAVFRMCQFMSN